MPFKSKAQRRKFAELLVKGEISEETFEEWNRETGGARLPERVKAAKTGSSKKTSAKRRSRPKASSKAKGKTKRATGKRATRKSARRKST
jgi:hypothetical protein